MTNPFDVAIQTIHEHGWIQGQARSEHGFCLVGALAEGFVINHFDERQKKIFNGYGGYVGTEVGKMVIDAVGPFLPSQWNDAPGRTVEDVLELLKLLSEEWELTHA